MPVSKKQNSKTRNEMFWKKMICGEYTVTLEEYSSLLKDERPLSISRDFFLIFFYLYLPSDSFPYLPYSLGDYIITPCQHTSLKRHVYILIT